MNSGPNTFAGYEVSLPEVEKNVSLDSAVGKAISQVRNQLGTFLSTIDADNPFAGKIVRGEGNEMVEKPLLDSHIYLVDDDPTVSRAFKRILGGKKFSNIQTFNDGQEAFEHMHKDGQWVEIPDLIISDTNMPHMDGPKLAMALQNIEASKRPRFLALTGQFNDENIKTYVELGYPVMCKPVNNGNFLAMTVHELRQDPGFKAA